MLSICGVALTCAIARRFLENRGAAAEIGKIVTGCIMIVVLLKPLSDFRFSALEDITFSANQEAGLAVQYGEENTSSAMERIITEKINAYILQRAAELNVNLETEVVLSKADIPVPEKIYLKGTVAPFAKKQLQKIIEQEIGILKEHQIWT